MSETGYLPGFFPTNKRDTNEPKRRERIMEHTRGGAKWLRENYYTTAKFWEWKGDETILENFRNMGKKGLVHAAPTIFYERNSLVDGVNNPALRKALRTVRSVARGLQGVAGVSLGAELAIGFTDFGALGLTAVISHGSSKLMEAGIEFIARRAKRLTPDEYTALKAKEKQEKRARRAGRLAGLAARFFGGGSWAERGERAAQVRGDTYRRLKGEAVASPAHGAGGSADPHPASHHTTEAPARSESQPQTPADRLRARIKSLPVPRQRAVVDQEVDRLERDQGAADTVLRDARDSLRDARDSLVDARQELENARARIGHKPNRAGKLELDRLTRAVKSAGEKVTSASGVLREAQGSVATIADELLAIEALQMEVEQAEGDEAAKKADKDASDQEKADKAAAKATRLDHREEIADDLKTSGNWFTKRAGVRHTIAWWQTRK